ncbi:hypothetical protein H310_06436 [Aphanomyces invadans]|uniref:HSF-type DNA-binding domain-containing protein n=1 Tax=Aphanomyces invadans TaxID=157072 RepID=A0A024U6I9_9STRA|nr:hypothetical protein H310_06436 [Aphanomyces invadans]ETW01874.1 hypothetical protein H310_06436 [Aphanomyces invadans]|eukprot:XP_008869722.1 hypothetical protein H310_06436 [Aphanomyces invadans]
MPFDDAALDTTDADITELLNEGIFEYTSSGAGSEDSMDNDYPSFVDVEPIATTCSSADEQHLSAATLHDLSFAERTTKYLEKLYVMLEQCPETIAAWTKNGTSFAVFNCDSLEKTILPQFFKPIKFESFARQLNSYGFRKSKYNLQHKVVFEFSHPDFVRGQSDQLQSIKRRRRVKRGNAAVAAASSVTLVLDESQSGDVQTTLRELMSFVQSLQAELAATKALVQTLLEKKTVAI